ncbi:hypothetical protein KQI84_10510 [bacterium]|nr:hypothetical protein [bacterium]
MRRLYLLLFTLLVFSPLTALGQVTISTTNIQGDPCAPNGFWSVDIAVSGNTGPNIAAYSLRIYYDPASTLPTAISDVGLGGYPPGFNHGGDPVADAEGTYMGFDSLGNYSSTQQNPVLCRILFTNTASPAGSYSVEVAPDTPNVPLINVDFQPISVGIYDNTLTDPVGGATPTPTPSGSPALTISTVNIQGDPYAPNASWSVDVAVSRNTGPAIASYALRIYYDPASTLPIAISDVALGGYPPVFNHGGDPVTDAQGTYMGFESLGDHSSTQLNPVLCRILFSNTASPAASYSVRVAPDPPDFPLLSPYGSPISVGTYDNSLTDPIGDATPTPTSTPTASPTPIEFTFVGSREGWEPFGIPPYSAPDFSSSPADPGTLSMTATSNTDQAGVWQSPAFELVTPDLVSARRDTIPLAAAVPDGSAVFAATYRVLTDEADPTLVPQIRLRATAVNAQQSEVLAIESNYDAAYSATPAGTDYTLMFQPPASSPIFSLHFDMLNFYPLDSPSAQVQLETVSVEPVSDTTFISPWSERVYDFVGDQDGWDSYTVPGEYAEPTFSYDQANSRLGIGVGESPDFQFGFWGSTLEPSNNVAIEAGRMYYAVFTVETDIAEPRQVPEFRLRLTESRFRAGQFTSVAATGTAPNVPTPDSPREYTVYFPAGYGTGFELLCCFDMRVDPQIQSLNVGDSIYLSRVEVFSVPAP